MLPIKKECYVVTAGDNYLDIDAYACCVAMAELLCLKGEDAIAFSTAPYNYSVCDSLVKEGQISKNMPLNASEKDVRYIIVDVSDPNFLKSSVPLDRVVEVYDHHVGFEEYWNNRIGNSAKIEFIGAAATLIYREWEKNKLQAKMKRSTALLLIAAILDNTLNLTSSNTTLEDIEVFNDLCARANIDKEWCSKYFSEVQSNVEADLKNALTNDIKTVKNNAILPPKVAQMCVWNTDSIFLRLSEIREFLSSLCEDWMINIIDIKNHCGYFVCDKSSYHKKIENIFDIRFEEGIAKTAIPYLRKEIIKKTHSNV